MMKKILYVFIGIWSMVASLQGQMVQSLDAQNGIGFEIVLCDSTEVLVNEGSWRLKSSDFIRKGYTPVRVKIKNTTGTQVVISEKSVQFAPGTIKDVEMRLQRSEIIPALMTFVLGNGTGAILTGLFGLTAYCKDHNDLAQVKDMWLVKKSSQIAALCLGGWIAVNAIVPLSYYFSRSDNHCLYAVLSKALGEGEIIIGPNSSAEKILLVPVGVRGQFSFSVFDELTGAVVSKFYTDCAA